MSDAFLAERGAHYVRDADYVCDARLRRVSRTHRITYHSVAASLITYLQSRISYRTSDISLKYPEFYDIISSINKNLAR